MLWILGGLFTEDGIIRNWAKWSDIEKVKFPEVQFSNSGLFEKILSINVWDLFVTREGSVIWGTKRLDVRVSKKSLISVIDSDFNKSILKSPAK